ncbi:D-glycerate dehydrogenase [bacterium]|nr:D-glycerate dehydrogenase [bacterium]
MTNPKPKVFVARQIPAVGLDRIIEQCDADVWPETLPPTREQLLSKVVGCEGLLTLLTDRIDAEVMDAAGEQLKVISNFAVGYNNIDVGEATRRGIVVGNTPGVLTEATADIAFALLIAAARCLHDARRFIDGQKWKTWDPMGHIGQDLNGKTIGIVGMGRIGAALARRCYGGWGMRVLYCSRTPKPDAERDLNATRVTFDELLAESDFVSAHTSLSDETHGMFNAAAFKKMKPTSVFVNTARGPVHNQVDLCEALKSGEIFAAGLDVTDPEPIAADDPILQLPNCVIAPHIGSGTTDSRNGMSDIATDNLLAGLNGEPLRHQVSE